MGFYDQLTKSEAKAALKRAEKSAKRLVERRDLASANIKLRQRDIVELRARIKAAPAERKFFY